MGVSLLNGGSNDNLSLLKEYYWGKIPFEQSIESCTSSFDWMALTETEEENSLPMSNCVEGVEVEEEGVVDWIQMLLGDSSTTTTTTTATHATITSTTAETTTSTTTRYASNNLASFFGGPAEEEGHSFGCWLT